MGEDLERLLTTKQRALLKQLAAVIKIGGYEPLVTSVLIDATEEFFPDPWRPTPVGVSIVIRRLLFYIGLDSIQVEIEDYRPAMPEQLDRAHEAPDVRLVDLNDERALFELHAIGNAAALVGLLCHEVGRLFLQHQRRSHQHPYRAAVEAGSELDEDAVAAVAAVYLGFGVIVANEALAFSQTSALEGGMLRAQWSTIRVGALPPEALVFLLAVSCAVAEMTGDDRSAVKKTLYANESADFRRWMAVLQPLAPKLRERLGVPEPDKWPDAVDLVPRPFDDLDPLPAEREIEQEQRLVQFNAGRPVFRVKGGYTGVGAGAGALAGLLTGLAIAGPVGAAVGAGAACLIGALGGRRIRRDRCSDPDCETRLLPGTEICPRCGGTISGEIDDANDRLAAEEALEKQDRREL